MVSAIIARGTIGMRWLRASISSGLSALIALETTARDRERAADLVALLDRARGGDGDLLLGGVERDDRDHRAQAAVGHVGRVPGDDRVPGE